MSEPGPLFLRLVFGRNPAWTLARIGALVVLTFVVFGFILLPVRVKGNSMQPNFHDGQIRVLSRRAYKAAEPQRGDVVAVTLPGMRAAALKRVVGLPGEKVQVVNGRVRVNGEVLEEDYTRTKVPWRTPEFELEKEQYFVIGDNRENTEAYRKYRHEILGKLIW